jgi:hypothetical protein
MQRYIYVKNIRKIDVGSETGSGSGAGMKSRIRIRKIHSGSTTLPDASQSFCSLAYSPDFWMKAGSDLPLYQPADLPLLLLRPLTAAHQLFHQLLLLVPGQLLLLLLQLSHLRKISK